jgi:hypothetical protein
MSAFGLELTERQRTLMQALYPVLLLLIANPLLEVLATSWPLSFDDPRWRVTFFGALLAGLLPVLTGLALIALLAALLGQGGVIRVVALAAFLATGVLIICGGLFGLDALQVRRMVRLNAKAGFDAASFKTLAVTGLMICASAWLGVRAFTASKGFNTRRGEGRDGLVVGQ